MNKPTKSIGSFLPSGESDHWSKRIPNILQKKNLTCINHTAETAQSLHDTHGFFSNGRQLSHEVEQHLFDAFIEDDFEGKLHLTTIHDIDSSTNGPALMNQSQTGNCGIDMKIHKGIAAATEGPPLGLVFWREVPEQEMHDWIDWKYLANYLDANSSNKMHTLPVMEKSLHLVRQDSVESMKRMVETKKRFKTSKDRSGHRDNTSILLHGMDSKISKIDLSLPLEEIASQITHAWIKIELVAVREKHWGRRLGSILIASALYQAYSHYHQSRVILHVAGGKENVPAVRLYRRFGFLSIKGGTLFDKPNRDLYVLSDISRSLDGLSWEETLEHTTEKSEKVHQSRLKM